MNLLYQKETLISHTTTMNNPQLIDEVIISGKKAVVGVINKGERAQGRTHKFECIVLELEMGCECLWGWGGRVCLGFSIGGMD